MVLFASTLITDIQLVNDLALSVMLNEQKIFLRFFSLTECGASSEKNPLTPQICFTSVKSVENKHHLLSQLVRYL